MAFNTVPTHFHWYTSWEVTYADVKTKIRLHIGERQAQIVQNFQSFMKVATLALGGGGKPKEKIYEPKSFVDLQSKFASMF